MALTIATISLCLFIVLIQHLSNWFIRRIFDKLGEYSYGPASAVLVVTFMISTLLFKLLIEINK